MRINSIPPKELYTQYVYNKNKNVQRSSAARSSVDKVELTDQAQSFAATMKAAKEAMETPHAHLEELRTRIDNNTYQIPGAWVAERILGGEE